MDAPGKIEQGQQLLATIWTLVAVFVNEKKTGSVTLHFTNGEYRGSDENVKRRA